MTSSDPYHLSGSGDRTWNVSGPIRLTYLVAPIFIAVVFASMLPNILGSGAGFGWFGWVVVALMLIGLPWFVADALRTAHRVTLHRDGSLELGRPIGTVRIRIDQVRAMRVSRFDNDRSTSIRMVTDQGEYRVLRRLDDVGGLAEALRERNPRIELPSI